MLFPVLFYRNRSNERTVMSHEKHVDESWKEAAAQAKTQSPEENASAEIPQVDFINYVTSMALQAVIFLGDIPHPVTNKIEKNLDQAKFIIDTLIMIREKTKGNLEKPEEDILSTAIYELQSKFIAIKQQS